MTAVQTDSKEDKTGSSEREFRPISEMFEKMETCCDRESGYRDCATMMKSMMGSIKNMPCCGPGSGKEGAKGREK